MKSFIKVILRCSVALSLVLTTSCEDYLDATDESVISPDEAFENFTNFQGYTEELYHCIPDFTNAYWTNSWNWGEDEIQSSARDFHFGVKIDNGNFWGWQSEHDGWQAGWMDRNNTNTNDDRFTKSLWKLGWYGIRKANMGLENLDKMTGATEEERNLIKGQLLFFRGWFHFQFMQYFGGLPYIDYVLPSDEKLTLPRLSYQECAEKAAQDFREAADLLPVNWDNTTVGRRTLGKNALRINKIMALGYLGKNYLWAGSPLMNSESTGSRSYNPELCQKAAAAFAELLNLCESGEAPYRLLPFSEYSKNFYTTSQNWQMPGGTEAIFRGPYYGANGSNWGTSKQYQPAPVIADGDVKFLPTANYVDYYGMANGLPIKDITQADAESGYDPAYPWRGRDPRFYNDIVFDGVKVVQGSMPDNVKDDRYANLFTGGSYRNVSTGSRTGYLLYKFIPITANKYDNGYGYGNSLNIHIPWMRLADIYIMYAEAAAQGYGAPNGKDPNYSKTAVEAINVVRDRAGVGHVADQFQGSLDAFTGEVRRERAVELAFEGHRFNDLRRWLLLTESPYTLKKSVEFDRAGEFNTEDPRQNRVVNLREEVILERKFSNKHYWLPLKNNDVNMYLEFAQNPGW
ncbi:putative outer membrane starch-binding protein [Pontibacter ummariensis]|uniref:Starch-binding associating with outer membrane n=1 Tax=Pontibacter ummariensis TaxID=1610492 RepID=A0A239K177_9BACT|nr:RagB/SusD family nutrient uptake outer membrane protein [Pontibacter ummariensis]PRY06825.1 putative outer membrane starch-binding protein [Pontibacter ummariensis]SNT11775.1 Starch-binding associating with outer membrane [Pontibacter ummariensis]